MGRVLSAIDDLGFHASTVVAFMADHGYQLGEHSFWEKYTNYELATRVPFIIRDPSRPAGHGQRTDAFVEAVDMYPSASPRVERGPSSSPALPCHLSAAATLC